MVKYFREEVVVLCSAFTSLDRIATQHLKGGGGRFAGLLSARELVLGFGLEESEANELVRDGCGRGGGRKEDSEMHTHVYMSTRECGRGGVRKESQGVAFSKGC